MYSLYQTAINEHSQSLCLNMIVKNEVPVIRRCLNSVRPVIDCWVIVDTGSSDGTQDVIRRHLSDLPGELIERPWVDFAHNRSEAVALARGRADYVFVIDADETLEIPARFKMPRLTADSYNLEVRFGTFTYARKQLLRNSLPWRYEASSMSTPVVTRPVARSSFPVCGWLRTATALAPETRRPSFTTSRRLKGCFATSRTTLATSFISPRRIS